MFDFVVKLCTASALISMTVVVAVFAVGCVRVLWASFHD